ncbi:MAG: Oligosaccharyl transferase STT3 subunit [Candidatus Methanofastidiosum methylothiophilum]|uniref:Oligosaccharyl transferase STT3 subunit n=1 Tax=Candidatus Methanofastidiosum methylothiophilum TaxID=1705564 RepID=A0A150IWA3_9EURY|nr:MAG: Oligosaccharyl transferase STT3 subunit [Candidatus Methanofastidiosum methylthiophilus]KYC46817.1 MAG: Oligosaccharyl transferase STT3 subunit [Candidatus Methanofastidiosum methylthiophilus]KYC49257.1 MAG: Oligosaccharyl transferase STT3 subunit [Candidatus Methanofastidiosum methylthiophilus]
MALPQLKDIKYFLIPIILIIILAFCETYPLYNRFPYPLSWDIWYHMRIVENFTNGFFTFDPVSFGPDGRIHTYPPLFHILLLGAYKLLNLGGLSIMDAARVMPSILFTLSAISTFVLVNRFYGREIGLLSSFFVLIIPVSLDRGIIASPQSLALVLMPLGFLMYLLGLKEKKYIYISGIISSAVFYTHGLSFIVFFLSILLFTFLVYLSKRELKVNPLLLFTFVTIVLSLPWIIQLLIHGVASNIPYGGVFKISFYPVKLGYITMALAIPGAVFLILRKKEEDLMLLSWGIVTFLLSRNYLASLNLLPFRFIEFLAYPIAFFSAFAIFEFTKDKKREPIIAALIGIMIISSFPAAEYVSKVKPMLGNEEYSTFSYLHENSLFGNFTVASSWFTSPIIGKVSGLKTVEGGYSSGSWDYIKRSQDIKALYSGNHSVIDIYNIKYAYIGPREVAEFKNSENHLNASSIDKLYSTGKTSLYIFWGGHYK